MEETLFKKVYDSKIQYIKSSGNVPGTKMESVAYGRFLSVWELVEELDLVDCYAEWLNVNELEEVVY